MPRNTINREDNSKMNARQLRKGMTKEEKHLWYDFLSEASPKFQRQKVIGKYIVDFYCAKLKLAIELDGSQHFEDEALEYDKARTEYINSLGIKVIIFTNHEINTQFQNVCETIFNVII